MKTLIENHTLRNEITRKGKERLSLFSWKKAAMELTGIFKKVAAK